MWNDGAPGSKKRWRGELPNNGRGWKRLHKRKWRRKRGEQQSFGPKISPLETWVAQLDDSQSLSNRTDFQKDGGWEGIEAAIVSSRVWPAGCAILLCGWWSFSGHIFPLHSAPMTSHFSSTAGPKTSQLDTFNFTCHRRNTTTSWFPDLVVEILLSAL